MAEGGTSTLTGLPQPQFYYNEQKGLLVASLASLFAEKFFKDVDHIEQKRYWSSVWAGKWHPRLL